MSNESNKETVMKMHSAIARGDLDGMFADMTDDVTFQVIGNHKLGQRVYQGKEDITNNLLMVVFAGLDGGVAIDIQGIAADNDKVFLQFTGTAKMRNGEAYDNDYVQVFDFRNGKICGVTEYLDTALLAKVLGE